MSLADLDWRDHHGAKDPAGPLLLKRYREAHGVSQSKLGDLAELDHAYINRIEAGKRQPSIDAVRRIARGMKLTVDQTMLLLLAFGYLPDPSTLLCAIGELMGTCDDP